MSDTPLVIYHGKCADGYTAAWIALKALRPVEAELFPGVYHEPLPNVDGRVVYVLDFSYTLPVMQELLRRARQVIWIDHHATAIAESGHLMYDPQYKRNYWDTLKHEYIDMLSGTLSAERSGAWLTWEWFHGKEAVPTLVQLVDDRDRWQFKLPGSRHFAAGLFMRNYEEPHWDYASEHVDQLMTEGAVIDAKEQKDVEEVLDVMTVMVTFVHGDELVDVPTANLNYMSASRAGETLLNRYPQAPFAATWFLRNDGKRVYSLRSRPGSDVDVGVIAKALGGGGHKHASGFAIADPVDKGVIIY